MATGKPLEVQQGFDLTVAKNILHGVQGNLWHLTGPRKLAVRKVLYMSLVHTSVAPTLKQCGVAVLKGLLQDHVPATGLSEAAWIHEVHRWCSPTPMPVVTKVYLQRVLQELNGMQKTILNEPHGLLEAARKLWERNVELEEDVRRLQEELDQQGI